MPASSKLGLYLLQLRSHPLCDGDAPEPEAPVPGLSTDVGKAQEVKGLWLLEAPLSSVLRRKATELYEAGLIGMQFQVELRESFTKVAEELPCITKVLEPDHEVIGKPRDDHVASCASLPPLSDPAVKAWTTNYTSWWIGNEPVMELNNPGFLGDPVT